MLQSWTYFTSALLASQTPTRLSNSVFSSASSQKMRLLLCFSCFLRRFHSDGAGGASQSHAADAKNTSLMNFSLYSPCCRFPFTLPLFKRLLPLISVSTLTLLTPRRLSHLWLVFLAELPSFFRFLITLLLRFSSSLPVWLGRFDPFWLFDILPSI